ncbi:hypothetical protein KCU78_g13710, partial [Aureobasidium melanogenum]
MTLPNCANMNALPLELKQRICSFLTPKYLKPLRLTCKVFATAAERYLIERFILFLHPESLATLRKIAEHEAFSKYLTTVIYDSTRLRRGSWETSQRRPLETPRWADYRPKTLTLNEHESYAELTTRIMRIATNNHAAAQAEVRAHRIRLKQLYYYQRSSEVYGDLKRVMKHAFGRCGRLKNVVLSSCHPIAVTEARAQFFEVAHSIKWWILDSDMPEETFWDPRAFESLTLIEMNLPTGFRLSDAQAMSNLKHLRVRLAEGTYSYEVPELRHVFEGICQLETLSLFASDYDITEIIKVIRSSNLRVCLIHFDHIQGDELVDFLLHSANTLQRLAIGFGSTGIGWAPVLCSISCRFPALKRVQLEDLKHPVYQMSMSRDAELQAERFVLSGGLKPLIQYTTITSNSYDSRGRGFSTNEDSYEELPSGLWTDYEKIANEYWDGSISEDEDMDVQEGAGEEAEEDEDEHGRENEGEGEN